MKIVAVLAVLLTAGTCIATAEAAERRKPRTAEPGLAAHQKSDYYRSTAPQTRTAARRGGYSFSWADTINTYGDSRVRYGGINAYRDAMTDRQSSSGPFDHGFFFDSGIGRLGGNSPYLH